VAIRDKGTAGQYGAVVQTLSRSSITNVLSSISTLITSRQRKAEEEAKMTADERKLAKLKEEKAAMEREWDAMQTRMKPEEAAESLIKWMESRGTDPIISEQVQFHAAK
jgi:intergrase/recombinase